MATTAANYQAVAKEVWDGDQMLKQFYDECPWLDMIEQKRRVVIGKRAQVPLHQQRAGGITILDASGGVINAASSEVVGQAQYTLAYHYFPVSIEAGALNEISGGAQSVGEALEHMMSSGINNLRNQVTREFLTGTGVVAVVSGANTAGLVPLTTVANVTAGSVSGSDATAVGWLAPGDVVSVGTTADFRSKGATLTVTAVNDDPDNPTVTLSGTPTATVAGDIIAMNLVRGAGGNGTLKESAGLLNIAGTKNNVVGAVDANTNSFWNPALVDNTTTVIDMDLLLKMTRRSRRKGGKPGFLLSSLYQLDNIYQLLQSQVRFNGDREIGAGGSEQVTWRGNTLHAFPQVPENVLYMLDMDAFEVCVGKYAKPTWMSDIGGGGAAGHWTPGTTHFEDTVMYALGLAARRRNTLAAAVALQ